MGFRLTLVVTALLIAAASIGAKCATEPVPGFVSSLDGAAVILDSQGNPIIAYVANNGATDTGLRILHCADPACSKNGKTITSPASEILSVQVKSIHFGASGNPIVRYDSNHGGQRFMVCNDVACAGNDESFSPYFSATTSASALDSTGNPIFLSYNEFFVLVHCNDVICSGNNEVISPVLSEEIITASALALDAQRFPVIVYQDSSRDLHVLRCNDVNCQGNDETDNVVASGEFWHVRVRIDSAGRPVIAYLEDDGQSAQGIAIGKLGIIHCNDANCAGDDESASYPFGQPAGVDFGFVLDSLNRPIFMLSGKLTDVAGPGETELHGGTYVLHCANPNCTGTSHSVETIEHEIAGIRPYLTLDSSGNPVATFLHANFCSNQSCGRSKLKFLHCKDPNCALP